MVDCVCESCGKTFQRRKSDVNKAKRLNRRIFCSSSCSGRNSPNAQEWAKSKRGRSKDELSLFRPHARSIRSRMKDTQITAEYLKEVWEQQQGICPLTDCPMDLETRSSPLSASVDRIDNDKPYIAGNIRFISLMGNLARNKWDDAAVIGWCNLVAAKFKDVPPSNLAAEFRVGAKNRLV